MFHGVDLPPPTFIAGVNGLPSFSPTPCPLFATPLSRRSDDIRLFALLDTRLHASHLDNIKSFDLYRSTDELSRGLV